MESKYLPPHYSRIRSNKAQIIFLSEYMLANPGFTAGKNNAEWHKLKEALDELGPKRSVDQWKICWRDQKRKARTDAKALKQATGDVSLISNLIDTSALVLDKIEQEKDVGCGPEESPIGFSQDTTLHPLAQSSTSQCPVKSPVQYQVQHRARRRKARQTLPSERFLNAQIELNNLIKELIKEVHRSNDLREEHLNLLRSCCPTRSRRVCGFAQTRRGAPAEDSL